MSMRRRVCPKCHEFVKATKHHLLPKRFYEAFLRTYGRVAAKRQFPTIYICRKCHDDLEKKIPLVVTVLIECLNALLGFLATTLSRIKHLIHGDIGIILEHAYWRPRVYGFPAG